MAVFDVKFLHHIPKSLVQDSIKCLFSVREDVVVISLVTYSSNTSSLAVMLRLVWITFSIALLLGFICLVVWKFWHCLLFPFFGRGVASDCAH